VNSDELEFLLDAERHVAPPEAARQAGWARLQSSLAEVPGTAPQPPRASGFSSSSLIIGAVISIGVVSGWLGSSLERTDGSRVKSRSPISSASPPASQPTTTQTLHAPERSPAAVPSVPPWTSTPSHREQKAEQQQPPVGRSASGSPSSRPSAAPAASDEFSAELAEIRQARSAIGRGDYAAAMAHLREHAQRFPAGVFRSERSGLTAIAACRRREPAATSRARAFIGDNPTSVLIESVVQACGLKEPSK